jgi:hypothetical protein
VVISAIKQAISASKQAISANEIIRADKRLVQTGRQSMQITPCPPKGPKKTLRYFFIAFELGIVFCSPCQGEQNTMLSSKAKKKIKCFFSGLFGGRA